MKRDVILGSATAAVCFVLYNETLSVRNFSYAKVGAEVWPQIIIGAIFVLSVIQVVSSLRTTAIEEAASDEPSLYERIFVPVTVFSCVALFAWLVPNVGFSVAGVLMVFMLLTLLGPKAGRMFVVHAAVACVSVFVMTLIFSQIMGIFLPGWGL